MTIGPPIPEIQFDLENSRLKAKVKGTVVSVASTWLITFSFYINWTNHSHDMANKMLDWGNGFKIVRKKKQMGAEKISHMSTMCGFKKLPSGVFLINWKSVGRTAAAAETEKTDEKQILRLRGVTLW